MARSFKSYLDDRDDENKNGGSYSSDAGWKPAWGDKVYAPIDRNSYENRKKYVNNNIRSYEANKKAETNKYRSSLSGYTSTEKKPSVIQKHTENKFNDLEDFGTSVANYLGATGRRQNYMDETGGTDRNIGKRPRKTELSTGEKYRWGKLGYEEPVYPDLITNSKDKANFDTLKGINERIKETDKRIKEYTKYKPITEDSRSEALGYLTGVRDSLENAKRETESRMGMGVKNNLYGQLGRTQETGTDRLQRLAYEMSASNNGYLPGENVFNTDPETVEERRNAYNSLKNRNDIAYNGTARMYMDMLGGNGSDLNYMAHTFNPAAAYGLTNSEEAQKRQEDLRRPVEMDAGQWPQEPENTEYGREQRRRQELDAGQWPQDPVRGQTYDFSTGERNWASEPVDTDIHTSGSWGHITGSGSFGETSETERFLNNAELKANGSDDPLYRLVHGEAEQYLMNPVTGKFGTSGTSLMDKPNIGEYSNAGAYALMTDDEVDNFDYLLANVGKEAARNYVDSLNLTERESEREREIYRNLSDISPVAESISSIGSNKLAPASYIGQLMDYANDGEIDENAWYNRPSYKTTEIRGEVAKKISDGLGGKLGELAGEGYQLLMSGVDSWTNAAMVSGLMGDLSKLGLAAQKKVRAASEAFGLGTMASSAGAAATIEAKKRGLTDDQAVTLGAIATAAEVLTEKVSLEALLSPDMAKDNFRKYLVKNMVAEGAEEVGSDIINLLGDRIVSGEESEWRQKIREYMAEHPEATEGQAFAHALGEQALSSLGSFAGGALLGGVGAVGYGMNVRRGVRNASVDVDINDSENISSAIEEGLSYDPDTIAYKNAEKLQNMTPAELAKENVGTQLYYNEMMQEEQRRSAVSVSNAVEQAIRDTASGRASDMKLDIREAAEIAKDENAVSVINYFSDENISEKMRNAESNEEKAVIIQEAVTNIAAETATERFLDGSGKTSTALAAELYDETKKPSQFVAAVSEIRKAALNGDSLSTISEIGKGVLTTEEKVAVYQSAQADEAVRLQQPEAQKKLDALNKTIERINENDEAGRNISVFDSSKRNAGASTGVESSGMAESSGQTETAEEEFTAADKEALKVKTESRPTSAWQLGLKNGDMDGQVLLVTGNETEEMKAARSENEKKGLKTVYFVGGNLSFYGRKSSARGVVSGDTVYIRADHPQYTAAQISGHERTHKAIERGEFNKKAALNELRDNLGEDFNTIEKAYEETYAGLGLAYDEIMEEMICDFAGDMNIFAKNAVSGSELSKILNETARSGAKAVQKYMENAQERAEMRNSDGNMIENEEGAEDASEPGVKLSRESADQEANSEDVKPWFELMSKDNSTKDRNVVLLKNFGFNVNKDTGTIVRLSAEYAPATPEEIAAAVNAISEAIGITKEEAERYVKTETTLASLILKDTKGGLLNYIADQRFSAIKSDSDYPQGTVDFSNNCVKRYMMTELFNELQTAFPNRVFTATELETMRGILIKNGMEVNCAFCYVEERRQKLGEIGKMFTKALETNTWAKEELANKITEKIGNDTYIPTIADLITYDGFRKLTSEHPGIAEAFTIFNNARGMQAGRLIEGDGEYKREILNWTPSKVKMVNNLGGLRMFSFSDFDAMHLIDLVQIIQDCARKGVKIQYYTKQPELAYILRNTGAKGNRSLIAKGKGYHYDETLGENVVGLEDLDNVEGINTNDKYFFDAADNKNVGNIIIGIGYEQIKAAMRSDMINFIIPFHSGLSAKMRKQKGIDVWENYRLKQTEKIVSGTYRNGKPRYKSADKNLFVNIYTDVLQAAEKEGKPIENRQQFVEKFLSVCEERNVIPRFWEFLDTDENGKYIYTPGYEKFLVDYKLFDREGNIIPQEVVNPDIDLDEAQTILNEYVAAGGRKHRVNTNVLNQVLDGLGLSGKYERNGDINLSQEAANDPFSDLKEQNAYLKRRLEQTLTDLETARKKYDYKASQYEDLRKQLKPGKNEVERSSAERMAKAIVKKYSSLADVNALATALKTAGDHILKTTDPNSDNVWKDLVEILEPQARAVIMNNNELLNIDDYNLYKDMKKYLKSGDGISISEQDKHDIPDWNSFRKENLKNIKITNKGPRIDTVWSELQDQFGKNYFPDSVTTPSDKMKHLAEVMSSLEPIYGNTFRSYEITEAIDFLTQSMIDDMGSYFKMTGDTIYDKNNRRMKQIRETMDRKMEEAIRNEKMKADARVNNLKNYYKEAEQKKLERRNDTEARTRLLKVMKSLNTASKKMTQYNRAKLQEMIGELDTVAKSISNRKIDTLLDLREEYERAAEDPNFIRDKRTEEALRRLEKKRINDLTQEEVTMLTRALLNFENELRWQDRMIGMMDSRDTHEMGLQVIYDVENARGTKPGAKREIDKWLVEQTLSPVRFAHRLTGYNESDPLYKVFKGLADGERDAESYQMRAAKFFKEFTDDKKFMNDIYGDHAKLIEVEGTSGVDDTKTKVKITPAMRISLYLHSRNDQNMKHVMYGGVTIPDYELYKKGYIKDAYDSGTKLRLTKTDIAKITAGMSEKEKAYAEKIRFYFNEMSRPAINETSELLKGYSLAEVEEYFPINVDQAFVGKEFEALQKDGTIEGMGFTKERVESSKPILLRDVNDVLMQSIRMHSKYVGLGIPVRNFNKLWKVSEASEATDIMGNTVRRPETTVVEAIRRKWGTPALQYVEKILTDVQGGRGVGQEDSGLLSTIKGNYAQAVLSLNASVAIKQTASYPTAAAVLGFKPIAKALKFFPKNMSYKASEKDMELINRYTPLQWYRTDAGDLDNMVDKRNTVAKILGSRAMDMIKRMDVATTKTLWKAAEYYVNDHNENLKRGTDAYYEEVAKVYNRAIEETQPNYTNMQRPAWLRTDNTLLKAMLMFKTQPFQNFNILVDSFGNLEAKNRNYKASGTEEDKAALKKAKTDAANAAVSQVIQTAVFSAMIYLWKGFTGKDDKYRDDEGEKTLLTTLSGLGRDAFSSVFSMVPFGSDLYSFLDAKINGETYYGFDVSAMSGISDMMTGFEQMGNLLTEVVNDVKNPEETSLNSLRLQMDKIMSNTSKAFGIPYDNVRNMVNAVYRHMARGMYGENIGDYMALKLTKDPLKAKKNFADILWKTYKSNSKDYKELYDMAIEDGIGADYIKSAMEKHMKEQEGVASVKDLSERFESPEVTERYEELYDKVQKTKLWTAASEVEKATAEELMHKTASKDKTVMEKISQGGEKGYTDMDYILYSLALEMNDNADEKPGKHNKADHEAASKALGISWDENPWRNQSWK